MKVRTKDVSHSEHIPPTISVIVPVYNAEENLRRCVDSILTQSYSDFELLLVDDGSKDKSGAVCDEYAASDSRIRVFHKSNGGVSSARNLGLENACGMWIAFIDSDDWINETYLEVLYQGHNTDLAICSYVWDGLDIGGIAPIFEGTKTNDEIRTIIQGPWLRNSYFTTPWCKIYKKKIIDENHCRFNEDLTSGEDYLFNMIYLLSVDSIFGTSKGCYFYNFNTTGLSSVRKQAENCMTFIELMSPIIVKVAKHFFLDSKEFRARALCCEICDSYFANAIHLGNYVEGTMLLKKFRSIELSDKIMSYSVYCKGINYRIFTKLFSWNFIPLLIPFHRVCELINRPLFVKPL